MQSSGARHRIAIQPLVYVSWCFKALHLGGGNGSAWIISHDCIDDAPNLGASIAAPHEVKAGVPDEILVLAGRDRRRNEWCGIGDSLVGRGRGRLSLEGLLDTKDEEDEEEGGEELDEGSAFAPPRQQQVLLEQRPELLA